MACVLLPNSTHILGMDTGPDLTGDGVNELIVTRHALRGKTLGVQFVDTTRRSSQGLHAVVAEITLIPEEHGSHEAFAQVTCSQSDTSAALACFASLLLANGATSLIFFRAPLPENLGSQANSQASAPAAALVTSLPPGVISQLGQERTVQFHSNIGALTESGHSAVVALDGRSLIITANALRSPPGVPLSLSLPTEVHHPSIRLHKALPLISRRLAQRYPARWVLATLVASRWRFTLAVQPLCSGCG
jgi:hypothetical protein